MLFSLYLFWLYSEVLPEHGLQGDADKQEADSTSKGQGTDQNENGISVYTSKLPYLMLCIMNACP